jgi:hypothetical protein
MPSPIGTPIEDGASTPFADTAHGELLALWAEIMAELRRRNLVRTANNPVADYAEHLVSERLGLTLQGNSNAAYDAIAPDGTRYQIKSRRMTRHRPSRQLGAIRNLDAHGFDVLAIVLFEPTFAVLGIWTVPYDVVHEHAVYKSHVNAHVLHARPALLNDPRVKKIQ